MNPYKKNLSITLLSALLLAAAIPAPCRAEAKPAASNATTKASPGDPVAKVGKQIITRGELDRSVNALIAQKSVNQPASPEKRKQTERLALEQLVAAELLYQQGIKNPPKDLDKQVEQMVAKNKNKTKASAKDLKEAARRSIIINNYVEKKVSAKIKVTDQDVRRFYDVNQVKFRKDVQLRASHILCGVGANASADEKQKARKKAADLLKKVKGGADFAKLAKENSSCPSKTQGGDLGFFGRGDMVPPFEQAAYALKPGQVSDVVESKYGYHIIKLTDTKKAETIKFEDVKERIRDLLTTQKKQEALAEELTRLKGSHGRVEIMLK